MKVYKNIKQYLLRISLNLLLAAIFIAHVVGVIHLPFLERLENYLYDVRVGLDVREGQDPRIAIVDIDEKSLQAEGHWPWKRDKLALLLDNLFNKYHATLVGFDVVFAEPDESSGLQVLSRLAENELRDSTAY